MEPREIHLHLLVLCSSGGGVIIYRASDNWQRFLLSTSDPGRICIPHPDSGSILFGKVQPGFVNYSVCHRPKNERKKEKKKIMSLQMRERH